MLDVCRCVWCVCACVCVCVVGTFFKDKGNLQESRDKERINLFLEFNNKKLANIQKYHLYILSEMLVHMYVFLCVACVGPFRL